MLEGKLNQITPKGGRKYLIVASSHFVPGLKTKFLDLSYLMQ